MASGSWYETFVGSALPAGLASIEWKSISGGGQDYGDDALGNDWRRDTHYKPVTDGYRMWTHLSSDYRWMVDLVLYVDVDKEGVITGIDTEAWVVGHGRPAGATIQMREYNQLGRHLKALSKVKPASQRHS